MEEEVPIMITDPETSKTYTFSIPAEDYARTKTDKLFAQDLLSHAIEHYSPMEDEESEKEDEEQPSIKVDDSSEIDPEPEENEHNFAEKSKHQWQFDNTICLIDTVKERFEDLTHPVKRKNVWDEISADLARKRIFVTPAVAQKKWRNLIRSYKIVAEKHKTGTGATKFLFFNHLHEILKHQMEIVRPKLISLRPIRLNAIPSTSTVPDTPEDTSEEESVPTKKIKLSPEAKAQSTKDLKLELLKRKLDLEERKIHLLEQLLALRKQE